jgi:hypothetical protein
MLSNNNHDFLCWCNVLNPPWSGMFFKLARCGYTLRVTSQASYSPEYITPTQKIMSASHDAITGMVYCAAHMHLGN